MIRIFQGYNEPTISNLGVYQQDMVVSSKLRTLALSQAQESVHGGMPIPPLWEHNKNVCQMFVYGSHLLWASIRELLVTQRMKFCQQPIGSSRYIDGLWHTQTGHRRLCHSEGYPWHTQATCLPSGHFTLCYGKSPSQDGIGKGAREILDPNNYFLDRIARSEIPRFGIHHNISQYIPI